MQRTRTRTMLILAGVALTMGACARRTPAQTSVPAAATQPARTRPIKVIPWIEVNRGTDEEIENAVRGLLVWRKITDTAVVSTEIGHAWIYAKILPRVPGMHIIPGLKTAPHGARFDSVAAWRNVSNEVRRVCAATNERRCTLDSESPLKRNHDEYWNAKVNLDWAQMRQGLELFPKDVELWWYPSFVGSIEVQFRQSERMARAVQEATNVRFVTWELARPPGRNTWWNETLGRLRDEIARKPSVPIIYFYFEDKFWPIERAVESLSLVSGEEALIFPGAKHWVIAAENITRAVQAAGLPMK